MRSPQELPVRQHPSARRREKPEDEHHQRDDEPDTGRLNLPPHDYHLHRLFPHPGQRYAERLYGMILSGLRLEGCDAAIDRRGICHRAVAERA